MENREFNEKLLKIWKEHKELVKTYPLLCPEFKKDCILFIGINPSFSNKAFKRMKESRLNEEKLKYPNFEEEKWIIGQAIKDEKEGKNIHPYFKKFIEIARGIGQDWEHLDLFFFRETSQDKAKKMIEYKKGIRMNDFGLKQLKLSLETMKDIEPKVIVVSNALASDIIKNNTKIDSSRFNEEGFHRIYENKTPIIFSSMLTGQRALDNHSLERLIWIIKRALNFIT